jgi:hypothetical protein
MSGPVLLLAVLFNVPVIWRAFIDQTVPMQTAVVRVLIAIPIAWLLVGAVRLATRRGNHRSPTPRAERQELK